MKYLVVIHSNQTTRMFKTKEEVIEYLECHPISAVNYTVFTVVDGQFRRMNATAKIELIQ